MDISITSDLLQVAARMQGFGPALDRELLTAMGESLNLLQAEAADFMYATFKNPQGPLEDAFYQMFSVDRGELANPMPYAWRRERGFSGMTDSLGRTFHHDPGIAYMQHSIDTKGQDVGDIFTNAVGNALISMGVL